MASEARLKFGAIFFAVFWTLGMWWWSGPGDVAGFAILAVAGALAGLFWFWAMRLWNRWYYSR